MLAAKSGLVKVESSVETMGSWTVGKLVNLSGAQKVVWLVVLILDTSAL